MSNLEKAKTEIQFAERVAHKLISKVAIGTDIGDQVAAIIGFLSGAKMYIGRHENKGEEQAVDKIASNIVAMLPVREMPPAKPMFDNCEEARSASDKMMDVAVAGAGMMGVDLSAQAALSTRVMLAHEHLQEAKRKLAVAEDSFAEITRVYSNHGLHPAFMATDESLYASGSSGLSNARDCSELARSHIELFQKMFADIDAKARKESAALKAAKVKRTDG